MTPSELKYNHEQHNPGSVYFSRKTMKFWGDTMRNYGVCAAKVVIGPGKPLDVWCLYRKKPVKHGYQAPAFFSKTDFLRIHNVKEVL